MPRTPLHTLIWSQDHAWYELFSFSQVFVPGDEEAWRAWLEVHDSFAFQGRLNVYKEARPRGGQYWYAYHTTSKRTHKRYLGHSAKVTFARLEEVAEILTREEPFHQTEPSFVDTTRLSFPHPARPERQTPVPPAQGPEQMQPASILLPKLRPPRLPSLCISRGRLLARMEESFQGKLTFVLAPAGSGKTTLVRQWIETQGQGTMVSWLSLDPEDDDPIRFWRYVLTACEHFEGKPGHDALQQLSTNQSFFTLLVLKQILTAFLNNVAEQTSRLLLVLDDYHVITSSLIHESLAYLVDHLPSTLHLVILSRSEPALPLARWRGRGDLQEFHAADLRFSPEEMAAFLRQALQVPLPKEQLQSLEARLEGWPTGLRLLALTLQGKSERQEIEQVLTGFSGSHRYLLDYVALEVL